MQRILVTGMSGTGKSSVIALLAARGHAAIDTDSDEWSEWQEVAGERDWVWREDRMEALLSAPRGGLIQDRALFVCGCKSNQGKFYPRFDHIVLLSARPAVMFARIAARDNNPYGKSEAERALILEHLEFIEPLLRAGADLEIETSDLPLEAVADRLERLARA